MAIDRATLDFPDRINRYSALKYLQKKFAARAAALPQRFGALAEWEKFKAGMVAGLKEKLPIWELDRAHDSKVLCVAELGDDLILERVDVYFDEGFYIPANIYRPKSQAAPAGAALVCPGYVQGKNDPTITPVCIALAKAGVVAIVPDYPGAYERADRPDPGTDVNNITGIGLLIGVSYVGMRVMTNLAVLRYLKSRPEVEPSRIGITGLCEGSITTWFTAAVCEEFKAVAPLCGGTNYEAIALEYMNRQGGWSGCCTYIHDIMAVADVQHMMAAIAPRPLFVQNNLIDIHWPASGFARIQELCENVYGLYGAPDKCRFRYEDGPHAYGEPFLTNIVTWMANVLRK